MYLVVCNPAAKPPPARNQTSEVSSKATTHSGGMTVFFEPSGGTSLGDFREEASPSFPWNPNNPLPMEAFSGLVNPFGSSAPAFRSKPGQAATAGPRVPRVGYFVKPSSASRNDARSAESGTTCRWFVATAAAVSVSLTTYSRSSEPCSGTGTASTCATATPMLWHIFAKPSTTHCASATSLPPGSPGSSDSPPPRASSAAFTTSPRRRCATCLNTSHAWPRNSEDERKCPHASSKPERKRGARGAHSQYVDAAPSAATTAPARALPPAASPEEAQRTAAAK
mmetsp:Transcript_4495/g.16659  ORF Transcript_4495/g.16659 Transcript_4495/m.16659 type:complete len:282 (+) Transcript_4495:2977-3822(+)